MANFKANIFSVAYKHPSHQIWTLGKLNDDKCISTTSGAKNQSRFCLRCRSRWGQATRTHLSDCPYSKCRVISKHRKINIRQSVLSIPTAVLLLSLGIYQVAAFFMDWASSGPFTHIVWNRKDPQRKGPDGCTLYLGICYMGKTWTLWDWNYWMKVTTEQFVYKISCP